MLPIETVFNIKNNIKFNKSLSTMTEKSFFSYRQWSDTICRAIKENGVTAKAVYEAAGITAHTFARFERVNQF